MKQAYVFFAEGFEEIEALTVVDVLRRAGIQTSMVSIMDREVVTGRTGIPVITDVMMDDQVLDDADILVLPGGMPGTTNLRDCKALEELLKKQYNQRKLVSAICAAPMVLGGLGFLQGRKATIYPGMEEYLLGAEPSVQEVVVDGNVITSRGMGTAIPFALTIVEVLLGSAKAKEISDSIVYRMND